MFTRFAVHLKMVWLAAYQELTTAIDEYVAHHNINPKPFIWTKSARDILQKIIRANENLSSKQNATTLTMRGTKDVMLHSRDHSVADALERVAIWNAAMLFSPFFDD